MPELPEVETIVRGLRRGIIGKQIKVLKIITPQIAVMPKELKGDPLKGDSIASISRHGKYIKMQTAKGVKIIVHLRMTGQLVLVGKNYKPDKHVHLIVQFADGQQLTYRDIRKFGRWQFLPAKKDFADYIKIGKDALDITASDLRALISKNPKRKIKAFLLDQFLLAGIGNIYADEICYLLKLHPEAAVAKADAVKLAKAIKDVLNLAIKNKGTSVSDYLTSQGAKGNFQNLLKVYGQETCSGCGAKLSKKKVAGRTSSFCARCQRL
ncbi:MAG: DNA-formamidopyrimidine glycosylase [Candidatus Margulisiibacteriota bacterium]|jgi:formamidopyrimidine-DNA glycosylase